MAPVLAASAAVYLGSAALKRPAAAWPLFFATVVIITVARLLDDPFDPTWAILAGSVALLVYGLLRGASRPGYGLPLQNPGPGRLRRRRSGAAGQHKEVHPCSAVAGAGGAARIGSCLAACRPPAPWPLLCAMQMVRSRPGQPGETGSRVAPQWPGDLIVDRYGMLVGLSMSTVQPRGCPRRARASRPSPAGARRPSVGAVQRHGDPIPGPGR